MIQARPPLRYVQVGPQSRLDDYAAMAHLAGAVSELRLEAEAVAGHLAGRTVWMVSSTARGGGVAEMLPTIVSLLRDLGFRVEWVVIGSDDPAFFELTKRIHNLIHGVAEPSLGEDERRLYEEVNRANAAALRELVRPGDLIVIHDPQPLPIASLLRDVRPLVTVWRSHIGLDAENAATRGVWSFLAPYLDVYDGAVFSAPEYIPGRLARRASVIFPGIDPLAPKNRELSLRQAIEVMCNGGLVPCPGPTVGERYVAPAQRVMPDGSWAPASIADNIGLLTRPLVTQVSRWDRLKGFLPLLQAFTAMKRSVRDGPRDRDPVRQRQLDLVRLVLAGPDPSAIQDDPEAREVLDELRDAYRGLPPAIRDDIAILLLPMHSLEENALMVNALQRASTIVVQNSLREGFGLTIAEAMWKRIPVLSNSRACGPRQQIRDGLDGRLVADPQNPEELEQALSDMLGDAARLERWGQSAQRRVHEHFLVFGQLRAWGRLLPALLTRREE
jgi:trehalose synthase